MGSLVHRYKIFFLVILLIGLSTAFSVIPDYNGIKDTGNQNFPTLNVGITIDCDSKAIAVDVRSNETGTPVNGAKTYMFYTDYAYQALPNPGTTDETGHVEMSVPGNIRYLTALFILRTDATGYKSREIEYTYQNCFNQKPKPPPSKNITNSTPSVNSTVVTPPSIPIPKENTTVPTPQLNETNSTTVPTPKTPSVCPLFPAIILGLFIRGRK